MPTRSQARRHTRGAQSGRAARDVTNESAASKALRVIHVWRAWYSATASAAPSAVAKLPRWSLLPALSAALSRSLCSRSAVSLSLAAPHAPRASTRAAASADLKEPSPAEFACLLWPGRRASYR